MLVFLDTIIGFAVVMLGVSLIIMILNQAIAALLAHRGSNLQWGIETLLKNVAPGDGGFPILAKYSKWLSERTITHPLVSDSLFSTFIERVPSGLMRFVRRWQFANALKPDELRAILKNIADYRTPVNGGPSPATLLLISVEINALLGPAPPGSTLEDWFRRMNDRIAQRFTLWMRLWTLAFALVFAFVAHLDAIQLLKSLYKQGDVRTQLVGAAPQLSEIAGRIIPADATTEQQAITQNVTTMYTKALNDAVTKAGVVVPNPASGIADGGDVERWLAANVPDPQKRAAVKSLFDQNLAQAVKGTVNDAAEVYSKFGNIKIDGIGWGAWHFPYLFSLEFLERLAGVLASWLLLSLGAPFWFNSLSSLTSLRPVLAKK